jgi:hypothetical protein
LKAKAATGSSSDGSLFISSQVLGSVHLTAQISTGEGK